jgi:uncharacterized protein (DUF2147 family)
MKRNILIIMALVAIVCFAGSGLLAADPILGEWKTISDKTGKMSSIVLIFEKGGKYYGKITKLTDDPDAICTKCTGKKKDQPIMGMVFLWGLEKDGNEYEDGKILDPDNGKVYYCNMELIDAGKKLEVRGSLDKWGLAGRTQTWLRK